MAWENRSANNLYEPFCGVAALFNGDIHAVEPEDIPREEWQTLSRFSIVHRPSSESSAEVDGDLAKS